MTSPGVSEGVGGEGERVERNSLVTTLYRDSLLTGGLGRVRGRQVDGSGGIGVTRK